MKQRLKQYWTSIEYNIPFIIIVWTIGFCLLRKSASRINLDKPEEIHIIHLGFLGLAFFFILLPFIKTIKIGTYLELERNIRETKEEVKDFKQEVRQSVQMLSTSVTSSIGNLNSQVIINNLPKTEELKQEIEKLGEQSKDLNTDSLSKIKEELLLDEDDDIIMGLARTRIKLEVLLRNALGKRTNLDNVRNTEIKFLGLNSLFREYVRFNPEFSRYENSFVYVQKICNAAVHGQKVSPGQAYEALELGALIIKALNTQIEKVAKA